MSTPLGKLISGTAIYGVGGALRGFLNLLLLPLFTAYLTPAEFGVVALLTQVSFFLYSIFSLGLGTSIGIVFFSRDDRQWKGATIWAAFLVLMVSALVLFTFGIFFSGAIWEGMLRRQGDQNLVLLSIASACVLTITTPFMLFLQLEQHAKRYVIITILYTMVTLALSIIFVVHMGLHAKGMILATLFGQLANLIMCAAQSIKRIPFRIQFDQIWDLVRLGIPMIPAFAMIFILSQASKFELSWQHSLREVGMFSLGLSLGSLMTVAVDGFVSAWTPYFLSFANRLDEARVIFRRVFIIYILGFGFLSLLFFIFAQPLVRIVAHPAYFDSYQVVGITAASQLFAGVFSIFLSGPYFSRDVRCVGAIQGIAALTSVLVGIYLVSRFGMIGAGVMLLLGYVIMASAQLAWNQLMGTRYLQVDYPWELAARFAAIYVMIAGLSSVNLHLGLGPQISLSSLLLVGTMAAVAMLIPREERILLLQFVRHGLPRK